jgi:hypothetical protein
LGIGLGFVFGGQLKKTILLGPAGDFSLQFPTGYPATPRVTCPVYQPDPTHKGRHPQFIVTKGSAYLFLPSITALNHLATLSS